MITGLHWCSHAVQANSIETTVNDILYHWRDLWPGGLGEREYATLNLLAQCRRGALGFNRVRCQDCRHREWYASSCGNRHCPNCLGPRQAEWSQKVCERLPDCPHFHVVFTVPEQFREFFKLNYRVAADLFFAAVAETLKLFQKNNWKMDGGFLAVLHTWGSDLTWHPHLHVLVSAGGRDRATGRWREARPGYLFPVKQMSRVFRAILLRRLEDLEGDAAITWPEEIDSLETRRAWRVDLAGRNWNIFSRPTLGNTRAVVRYLARYTSRIAMSNHRIKRIDEQRRTVTFESKDYRNGGRKREVTLSGFEFLRRFSQHLVPRRFRRVRTFGLLAGGRARHRELPDAPVSSLIENVPEKPEVSCAKCGSTRLRSLRLPSNLCERPSRLQPIPQAVVAQWPGRYSLGPPKWPRKAPPPGPKPVSNKAMMTPLD